MCVLHYVRVHHFRCSSELSISCPIHLSGWLAPKSVRLFLDKNYRYHFLSMLGHDPPTNQCLDTVRGRGTGEEGGGVSLTGDDVDMRDGGGEEEGGVAGGEVDMDQEGGVVVQEEGEEPGGVASTEETMEQDPSGDKESCVGGETTTKEETTDSGGRKEERQDAIST